MEKMKIPEGLPQFNDVPTLIAVCGTKAGRVWEAEKGEFNELFNIEHAEIKYSDSEGSFASPGGFSGGSSPEDKVDEKEEDEFLGKFEVAVSKALEGKGPMNIYLFVPSYFAPKVIERFPSTVRPVVRTIDGNYVDRHPTEVLGMIGDISA